MEPGPSPERVAAALRSGTLPNERAFDQFLPYEFRIASSEHWTPLAVVLRVAEWLRDLGVKRVVDIGSGAGKFCIGAALATDCVFTGIEQRSRLVSAARALAETFGVGHRVSFINEALGRSALPEADAYYLYNPFGENLYGVDEHLGDDVEVNPNRYRRDVLLMEGLFRRAPLGTYVVKYNGFGGKMPSTYEAIRVDRELPNVLRVWRKRG